MTPNEYQELCFRTVSDKQKFWIYDGAEREAARRRLIANAALGMAGEAAEIRETPTSDECGDAYWYAYVFMKGVGIEPFSPTAAEQRTAGDLMTSACTLCEWVKKLLFHDKPLDLCLPVFEKELRLYVDTVATLDNATPSETFSQNIEKLKARYPEGFTNR